jgi:hypothetical protein
VVITGPWNLIHDAVKINGWDAWGNAATPPAYLVNAGNFVSSMIALVAQGMTPYNGMLSHVAATGTHPGAGTVYPAAILSSN